MFKWLAGIFLLINYHVTAQSDTCREEFNPSLKYYQKKQFKELDMHFSTKEIKRFTVKTIPSAVILENGYAKSTIKNPTIWKPDYLTTEITDIEIVFTKYPLDKDKWITSYQELLCNRLRELFKLDPRLNCSKIKYKLILQTDCITDSLARTFFHGIVIKYKKVPRKKSPTVKQSQASKDSALRIPYHKQVEEFIKDQGGLKDSTAYKIFDRHPEWRKSLVVMDWTSSMYPYGASVVLWHSLHYNQSGIKYYTFFNDGDNRPEYSKVIGQAGGIYHEKADKLDEVIKLFNYVKKKGSGGDIPENNIEALLEAQKAFPDFNELIMIADNSACIRDYPLSDSLKVPVKIILCGTEGGINPMYLNLAAKTHGSIHTIEEDIYSMQDAGLGQNHINIGGVDFSKNQDGLYVRTDGKKEEECQQFYVYKPKVKKNTVAEPPKPVVKETGWYRFLRKLGLAKKKV
jgi:hypothetical protein